MRYHLFAVLLWVAVQVPTVARGDAGAGVRTDLSARNEPRANTEPGTGVRRKSDAKNEPRVGADVGGEIRRDFDAKDEHRSAYRALGYASESASSSFYRLTVGISPKKGLIDGVQLVTYPNRTGQPLEEIPFHLRANLKAEKNPHLSSASNAEGFARGFEPSWTHIVKVLDAEGRPLEFQLRPAQTVLQTWSLEDGILVIRPKEPLQPAEELFFSIYFQTRIPEKVGDEGTLNGEMLWRFGWFPQERYWDPKTQSWATDQVLAPFRFSLELTVPKKYNIGVGADVYGESVRGRYRVGQARSEIPVRSIPLFLSDNYLRTGLQVGDIEVMVFASPDRSGRDSSLDEAHEVLLQAKQILQYYNRRLGKYRYRRLIICESTDTFLSVAADGFVALGDLFWIYNRFWYARDLYGPLGETTLAHELAHQWFGIGVGIDFDRDNWISEALAQILSLHYASDTFGEGANNALQPNALIRWLIGSAGDYRFAQHMEEDVIRPSYRDLVRFGLDGVISAPLEEQKHLEVLETLYYQKGEWVARALESLLTDQELDAALRTFHQRYAGSVASLQDFQAVAEEVSHKDLSRLFQPWIHGLASADYSIESVETEPVKDRHLTQIRLRRDGQRSLPVVMEATDEAGFTHQEVWDSSEPETLITLTTRWPITKVVLDPKGLVPDTNRLNNHFPRKRELSYLMGHDHADQYGLTFKPTRITDFGTLGPAIGGHYLSDHVWWAGMGFGFFTSSEGTQQDGTEQAAGTPIEPADSENPAYRWGFPAFTGRRGYSAVGAHRQEEGIGRIGRFGSIDPDPPDDSQDAPSASGGEAESSSGSSTRFRANLYASYERRLARGHSFVAKTSADIGPRENRQVDLQARLGYVWTLYSAPDLGLTAPMELPQTQLAFLFGPRLVRNSTLNERRLVGEAGISVARDDFDTLGLRQTLSITGGMYTPERSNQLYATIRWDAAHLSSWGRFGWLETRLALGYQSPTTPEELNFVTDYSDLTAKSSSPDSGGWLLQTRATFTYPLLFQQRTKNLFTLWSVVFNGLDADGYYTLGAVGPSSSFSPNTASLTSELGLGVTARLASFDGIDLGLRLGGFLSLWPGDAELDETGLSLSVVSLPY